MQPISFFGGSFDSAPGGAPLRMTEILQAAELIAALAELGRP